MLTMWTMGAVYFHLKLLSNGKSAKYMLLAGFFSLLCFLTHYYSLIFFFFLAACWFLLRLVRREWKLAAAYAAAMWGAVALLGILWPNTLTRGLVGSERGSEAFHNFKDLSVSLFAEHLSEYLLLIRNALFYTWVKELALLLALSLLALVLKRRLMPGKRRDGETGAHLKQTRSLGIRFRGIGLSDRRLAFLFLVFSVSAALAVIAKIAPYRDLRYVAFLLPIIILCFLLLAEGVFSRLFANAVVFPAAMLVLFAFITLLSYRAGNVLYRFEAVKAYDTLAAESPCGAAVCFYDTRWSTAYEVLKFLEYPQVYCTKDENVGGLQEILDKIGYSGDLVVYLDNSADQSASVALILENTYLKESKKLFTDSAFTAYYLSP